MDACIYIYCVVVGGRLSHTRHGQSPSWIGKRLVQAIECLPRRVSFSFTLFFIFSSISSFYFNRMRFLALSYRYFYCLLSLYIYPFKICSTSLRFFFFFPLLFESPRELKCLDYHDGSSRSRSRSIESTRDDSISLCDCRINKTFMGPPRARMVVVE